jgi:hypothetical protein
VTGVLGVITPTVSPVRNALGRVKPSASVEALMKGLIEGSVNTAPALARKFLRFI